MHFWVQNRKIHDGCSSGLDDSLEHYLKCAVLWNHIAYAIDCAEFRSGLAPVQKACLDNPSLNDLKHVIIAFKMYHALRFSHSDLVNNAISSGNFDKVYESLLAYLRHHARELSLCLVVH